MRRRMLLATTFHAGVLMALALPAHSQPAPNARPIGGNVVSGGATISQSPTTTTIDQSSQRAAINWQGFNIGSQQAVQFDQPNASAVVLNRVVGPNPSAIAGRIDANGQVVITNQSGVMFYKGSQVNTAGLMVSAAGISNHNFMAGRMVFDRAADPDARVVNQGTITVKSAGLAALVAPQVANSGVINARLGHVVLAGAERATLDLYGDGLMSIDVTGQVVRAPDGGAALVTNTGVISADGGTVQLTARAADGLVTNLVNAAGKMTANTVGTHTGAIVLAGVGGDITVAGQLSTTGTAPGTQGGNIAVNTDQAVNIASTARIKASGRAGGGVVAIGTTLARAKGGPGVTATRTAASVTVADGARITANATTRGNGGRVAVLSGGSTTFDGSISARGGPQGGNGGLVETSGTTLSLGLSEAVDTRAPQGQIGTWLLDPVNLTIGTLVGDMTPAQVVTGLQGANEVLSADNDITINSPINAKDIVTGTIAATGDLFLEAGRDLIINASVTMNGGFFVGTANASAALGTNLPNRLAGPGSITMAAGTTIDTSTGSAGIAFAIDGTVANIGAGGGMFLPGTATLRSLNAGPGAGEFVGGGISVTGGTSLVFNDAVNGGAVLLQSNGAGGITIGAPFTAATLQLIATGTGGISQSATGAIAADTLAITSAGPVSLLAANAVPTIAGTVSAAGAGFAFRDAAMPLRVSTVDTSEGDAFSDVAGITTNGGRVVLSTTGTGDITVIAPIVTAGGEIDVAAAPGSAVTITATGPDADFPSVGILNSTGGNSGGGNVAILGDAINFDTGAVAVAAGGGTAVLAPSTATNGIALGEFNGPTTLGLPLADFGDMTAAMVQLGYRNGTSGTGPILIGGTAGLALNPANFATLLLVTGQGNTVTQTQPLTFTAPGGALGVIAGGNVTLAGAGEAGPNAVPAIAGFTDNNSGFTYANGAALTVGALPRPQLSVAVDAVTGQATTAPLATGAGLPSNPLSGVTATGGDLNIQTTAGGLTLADNVAAAGHTATLISAGPLTETTGIVNAATLTGSSTGGATFNLVNAVATLGPFDDTGAGNATGLTFTNGQALATAGLVTSTGPLTLTTTAGRLTLGGDVTGASQVVTLNVAGAIDQVVGSVTAARLTGSSGGGATLTDVNAVNTLGPFTDGGSTNATGLTFTNGQALATAGLVTSTGPLTLTTTAGGLTLGGDVTGASQVVTLNVAGAIDQVVGSVTAARLTGSSVGGATLTDVNAVNTLGPFTDAGATNATGLAFTNGQVLATAGLVTSTGPLTLTTTAGGLTLGGDVTGASQVVTLNVAGAIDQVVGSVTAAKLTGSSVGGATLTDVNAVNTLGPFTDAGATNATGLTFTNGQALTVLPVSSTGPLALTTTAGGLTLEGNVTANGQTVTLTAAGDITETPEAIVTAGTLTGTSAGNVSLLQGNAVTTLGAFTATGGMLDLFDAVPLTITGPLRAVFLNVTAAGQLTVAGNIATIGAPLAAQSGAQPAAQGSTLQVVAEASDPSFLQTGTSVLIDGAATTLRIQLPASDGTASFNNLVGQGAHLVLALGSGTAIGTMSVGSLLVLGQNGSAALNGSIDGVATVAAAPLGNISPAPNPAYTFNGCEIAVGCPVVIPPIIPPPAKTPVLPFGAVQSVLGGLSWDLPGQALPPLSPVHPPNVVLLVTPPLLSGEIAPRDVVPPNISFEDY